MNQIKDQHFYPSKDDFPSPSSSTHPRAVTKGSEDVGVNLLTPAVTQPPLREVEVGVREDVRVSEVDAGVEVKMGSGGDVVS